MKPARAIQMKIDSILTWLWQLIMVGDGILHTQEKLCSSSLEYWGMKSWSSNIWHLPRWFIFCHGRVNTTVERFGDWLLSILQLISGTLVSHTCHIVQEKNVLTWSLFTFTTLVLKGDWVVTEWGEWNIIYSKNILPTWLPWCIKLQKHAKTSQTKENSSWLLGLFCWSLL